ncbi:MAG TPA: phosphate ABC transporter substrate-binding protein PstS [Streptosporangiaceae bacterium]
MRIQKTATAGVALAAVAVLAACSSSGGGSTTSSGSSSSPSASSAKLSGTLNGSGSTFQTTYQQAAIQAFKAEQSGLTVNYGGGGSGKGRTDLASGVVNYAGSDSPIPAKEASNFTGKTILYFPVVIGPIALSYNLSGVTGLKLDGPTIAKIFQGQIKTWNDPAITALNPSAKLPSTAITIARRSDSSGTTQNFSQFLVSSAPGVWKLGTSSTISWPSNSRGGTGNGGVDSIVKSTPGAIGYVDFADAKASNLSMASVKNSAGDYVAPSAASASAAAAQATVKPDLTFSAIWAPGASSYPVTYQSWDLVNAAQSSSTTTANLKGYLGYLLGAGQKLLPELNYAPLPASIDKQAIAQLSKIGSGAAAAPSSSSS